MNLEDQKLAIQYYLSGMSSREVGLKFNRTGATIRRVLRKHDIQVRPFRSYRTEVNDDYFNKIDTEHKAYWFGFMCADGYVNPIKNIVILKLVESDREIIDTFKKDIQYMGNLHIDSRHKNSQILISITSSKLSNDLSAKGCVQNKSLILNFPHIDKNLVRHFIRGYFDGDGCISGLKDPKIVIIGTKWFLKELNKWVHKQTGIGIKNLRKCPGYKGRPWNGSTMIYAFGGRRQTEVFFKWLYKDATRFLLRKKMKMENCINSVTKKWKTCI